ncbi:MAG: hypothetical protein R3245_04455 [Kiloniellales bacterium]|nr:hypothetical protein [Kiloniellales bacterium]
MAQSIVAVTLGALLLNACDSTAAFVAGAAGIATFVQTDKTMTDHAASFVSGQDCSILHVANDEEYCLDENALDSEGSQETYLNTQNQTSFCYRTIGAITCYSEPDPDASASQRVY